ncbi:hypothetical protein [Paraburkholderia adhaesiva]|uniref:hypothetical protein n=1 Tax=Paraburkholderia adhaesiva TaxID=2883244 RepID=UPI001F24880D|nr:hypothetical protein [Paraburkholderia adhaesiva]
MENITGRFQDGMKIGDTVHHDFEMRVPNTGDMMAAENEMPVGGSYKPITFNAYLAAVVLTRVGTQDGPISVNLIKRLSRRDFFTLRDLLDNADEEGNVESSDTGPS